MLNPVAVFKLKPSSVVEVIEDGETYTTTFVAATEVWTAGHDDAAMERLGATAGYIVQGSDSEIAIDKDDVVEIIRTDNL